MNDCHTIVTNQRTGSWAQTGTACALKQYLFTDLWSIFSSVCVCVSVSFCKFWTLCCCSGPSVCTEEAWGRAGEGLDGKTLSQFIQWPTEAHCVNVSSSSSSSPSSSSSTVWLLSGWRSCNQAMSSGAGQLTVAPCRNSKLEILLRWLIKLRNTSPSSASIRYTHTHTPAYTHTGVTFDLWLSVCVQVGKSVSSSCPDGWTHHRRRCYILSPSVASWASADRTCSLLYRSRFLLWLCFRSVSGLLIDHWFQIWSLSWDVTKVRIITDVHDMFKTWPWVSL